MRQCCPPAVLASSDGRGLFSDLRWGSVGGPRGSGDRCERPDGRGARVLILLADAQRRSSSDLILVLSSFTLKEDDMTKLSQKRQDRMPTSDFAFPKER